MTNGQTDGRARAIPMYVPSNSVGSGQLHLHLPGVNELNIFYDCQLLSWRRVHFTYNSLVIQNSWKITFSVIPFLFTISLHNFACVTTARAKFCSDQYNNLHWNKINVFIEFVNFDEKTFVKMAQIKGGCRQWQLPWLLNKVLSLCSRNLQ